MTITIEMLTDELERVTEIVGGEDIDDEADRALWARHWALRGLIQAMPARTHSELRAKARVLEIEAERDEHFECHVAGSARELARSLAADVIALMD